MTPYIAPATDQQRYFNKMHAKARCKVERCIGVLKSRFRCLLGERKLLYSHERASKIIVSCVVLHNFLIQHVPDIADRAEEVNISPIERQHGANIHGTAARQHRDQLASRLYDNRSE